MESPEKLQQRKDLAIRLHREAFALAKAYEQDPSLQDHRGNIKAFRAAEQIFFDSKVAPWIEQNYTFAGTQGEATKLQFIERYTGDILVIDTNADWMERHKKDPLSGVDLPALSFLYNQFGPPMLKKILPEDIYGIVAQTEKNPVEE